ncbi:unnamed protein product [Rotaria socialis]|uniref:ADP ribosyltransferase domain-containing protein n=1 Tax=Rotaria socialis TaxID=392032 RepID=A0A818P4F6_9BILA|nr:unnamed protein product [Rotaria socialis]CAF4671109.1 unnamed protein product [Rotaria socialis]
MNSRRSFQKLILYRGGTLTNEMIEEYKQAIASYAIKWLGFTSTSRDLHVAESFHGNTLFIIEIQTKFMHSTNLSDISSVSHHPDEQEVLLQAGHYFEVEKVSSINGKYVIYLVF